MAAHTRKVYIEPKRMILCVLHHPKCALRHPKFYNIKEASFNTQIHIANIYIGKQEEQKKSLQQSSACVLQEEKKAVCTQYNHIQVHYIAILTGQHHNENKVQIQRNAGSSTLIC